MTEQSSIPASADVTLRPPADSELATIRPWLRQAFIGRPPAQFLVAERSGDSSCVVGAASLRMTNEPEGRLGRFLLHVEPEHRLQGIGTALMRELTQLAAAADVVGLLAGRDLDKQDPQCRFFESLGFDAWREIRLFASRCDVALPQHELRLAKLQARGKIPPGYDVVPLSQANPEAVARLVHRHIGGFPGIILKRIRGGRGGYLPHLSHVIRSRTGPIAALLMSRNRRGIVAESRVVAPGYRNGWANALLLVTMFRKLKAQGIKEVLFQADIRQHAETAAMENRDSIRVVAETVVFGRRLQGHAGPEQQTQ